MKFQVMQPEMPVYSEMRRDVPPIRVLHFGEQAELGKHFPAKDGQAWAEIILPDGRRGYADAFASVFLFKRVLTHQSETQLFKTPGHGSVIASLRKGTQLDFLNPILHNGEAWVRVKDRKGNIGYIKADTRTLQQSEPTIASGCLNTVLGVLFFGLFSWLTLENLRSDPINWLWLLVTGFLAVLTIYQVVMGIGWLVQSLKK